MEERRKWPDPETHVVSKKIKIIETFSDGEIPNLPPEIILEILKRLPVKLLLRFRCVSKSWLYLISSSEFIKTHLDYSTNNPNFTNHRIVHTISNPRFNLKHSSVHSLLFEDAPVASDIDYPDKNPHKSVWVVGSCNGVVCIAIDEKDIFLWNPTMRTSKKLPPVDVDMKVGFYYMWGFGYNECDDDYKVVGIFCVFGESGVHESTVMMYSLKSDSWKRIEDFKIGIPLNDLGKYASGKLHFVATQGITVDFTWNIVSLDLKSEEYGMVEQPNYGVGSHDPLLGVLRGCICVLSSYLRICGDVWVLKEYNVKESWTKVISIPYINDPGKYLYSTPFVMLPNGVVLLEIGMNFIVYNPKDNSFRHLQITNADHSIAADMYVESLVSL
ncbi:hypothetical protein ACS0TY_008241 [Phlomoides rotata]